MTPTTIVNALSGFDGGPTDVVNVRITTKDSKGSLHDGHVFSPGMTVWDELFVKVLAAATLSSFPNFRAHVIEADQADNEEKSNEALMQADAEVTLAIAFADKVATRALLARGAHVRSLMPKDKTGKDNTKHPRLWRPDDTGDKQ